MTFTEFQRAGSSVANQGRERMQRQGRSGQEPIVEPWGKTLSSVPFSCSVVSDSSDPMDCSLPGSSVHGIFYAKVLEWGAIAFSEAV